MDPTRCVHNPVSHIPTPTEHVPCVLLEGTQSDKIPGPRCALHVAIVYERQRNLLQCAHADIDAPGGLELPRWLCSSVTASFGPFYCVLSPSGHHTTSFVTNKQTNRALNCITTPADTQHTRSSTGKRLKNMERMSITPRFHVKFWIIAAFSLLRQDFTTFGALELPAAVPASLPLPSTSVNDRLLLLAFSFRACSRSTVEGGG